MVLKKWIMKQERIDRIKSEFAGVYGTIELYIDGTTYHSVDVDADTLEGLKLITLSCGCCGDYEHHTTDLSYELEYMDEDDYQDLITELLQLKTKI